MPTFDHFHLIAPLYDRIFAGLRTDRLRGLLRTSASGWLLDVGGGTGRVAQALRGPDQAVILDVSVGMLRQARNKGLLVVQGEAEALPFRRETFSRILIVDTFHHLRDQTASAAELLRVLARGGRLVLEEFDVEHPLIKLVALGERLLLMRSHFHSSEVLRWMFETAGGRVRVERGALNLWLIVEGGLLDIEGARRFHGHNCPGLAIGMRAAEMALREIGGHAEDEEIVAIVETDMCAVDAIQYLTGCTFGKGNLIHLDYGKSAFTFIRRSDGKAIRIALRPEPWGPPNPEHEALYERVRRGQASEEDLRRVQELREQQIRDILERPLADLFEIRQVEAVVPARARIHDSVRCAGCGEHTMETLDNFSDICYNY